ncbi:MAG: histidinol-phosphatase HisJ family protein [Clostridiales bacterium]|nr:histidinol-phosphatase HisJ family protein [Clostridiales bacterium]
MNLNGFTDCHTHTSFSPDSDASAIDMCNRALELGLSAYAITDHAECNRWYGIEHYSSAVPNAYDTYNCGLDFENSLAFSTKLKEEYKGKLNLIAGIELGQATHDFEVADKAVSDKRLDFVIGSIHQLQGYDDFAFLKYENENPLDIKAVNELLKKNYLEILNLAKWGKFDVLGHLTYTLRYIEGDAGIKVDMTLFDDIIEEIFKTIIQNGNGIEINTSGLRQKYGQPFPTPNYVKMYKDLGGEILTLGSDAHRPEDIGKGIKEGTEIAKICGFKYIAYYKERKPNFIKL